MDKKQQNELASFEPCIEDRPESKCGANVRKVLLALCCYLLKLSLLVFFLALIWAIFQQLRQLQQGNGFSLWPLVLGNLLSSSLWQAGFIVSVISLLLRFLDRSQDDYQ